MLESYPLKINDKKNVQSYLLIAIIGMKSTECCMGWQEVTDIRYSDRIGLRKKTSN
jgi:hypothetical protein